MIERLGLRSARKHIFPDIHDFRTFPAVAEFARHELATEHLVTAFAQELCSKYRRHLIGQKVEAANQQSIQDLE